MANPYTIWPQFGFRANPYNNLNLPGDEVGDRLLVGRDREVEQLQRRIGSMGTHPTVEGLAGVGKSSLIAVATYRMLRRGAASPSKNLFVPCEPFQATMTVDQFEKQVYFGIAQTLIAHIEAFRKAGLDIPDVARLDNWLNDATFRQATGSIAGFGGGGGAVPNESDGYASSGFPEAVREQLLRCFPTNDAGAVVCVVDNLELLETAGEARRTLEALRDTVFKLPGTRWVLCGSRGIVSRARSARLSGVFDAPMRVGPLSDEASLAAVERRLEEFGGPNAYAPVPPEGFEFLYGVLNRNLRDAMAYAQQFSDYVYAEYLVKDLELPTGQELQTAMENWLQDVADSAHSDARGISQRTWQFFDQLAEMGGFCRVSDWRTFFSQSQNMSIAITDFKEVQLMEKGVDPENASRVVANLTPQGWLVYHHRKRLGLPSHNNVAAEEAARS
ncbi:ATP-binding protein [Nocardioides sp. Arc9.136]|uniref:ATP-binding protein n=1 Tax=Nocardioides sp. Arc9.136 TaxID=2996826 RepID=UPI0026661167|nr:ATP-binding protein [Nocardioides sp. Arc9.136]WKN48310.1 ATP-binding protein [Nocardioides sp. Arc9.136]